MGFGFDNQFLKCFADYLSNRTHRLYFKDEYPSELTVTCDGSQGLTHTKIIGSKMNLFSLQKFVNKAIKWSQEKWEVFNMANFEAICYDVKK